MTSKQFNECFMKKTVNLGKSYPICGTVQLKQFIEKKVLDFPELLRAYPITGGSVIGYYNSENGIICIHEIIVEIKNLNGSINFNLNRNLQNQFCTFIKRQISNKVKADFKACAFRFVISAV